MVTTAATTAAPRVAPASRSRAPTGSSPRRAMTVRATRITAPAGYFDVNAMPESAPAIAAETSIRRDDLSVRSRAQAASTAAVVKKVTTASVVTTALLATSTGRNATRVPAISPARRPSRREPSRTVSRTVPTLNARMTSRPMRISAAGCMRS